MEVTSAFYITVNCMDRMPKKLSFGSSWTIFKPVGDDCISSRYSQLRVGRDFGALTCGERGRLCSVSEEKGKMGIW